MQHRQFLATIVGLALLGLNIRSVQAGAPMVNLEEAREALAKATPAVIDIREPEEHQTGVAKGALLICQTQNRSSRLAEQLQASGYTNVRYVAGGMREWTARGWPLVKPPK